LEAYLNSLFRMCQEPLVVTVLYACVGPFEAAYDKLHPFFPHVNFIRENDFKEQVMDYLEQVRTPLFMFGCDDVVFKQAWEPAHIRRTFQELPGLIGFSLRLGKEITFCGTLGRSMPNPHFQRTNPFLVWDWPAGEFDWGYPWELDCTVYPSQLVRDMLTAIRKLDWAHPNKLEGIVAYLIRPMKALYWAAHHPGEGANFINGMAREFLTREREDNSALRKPVGGLTDLLRGMTTLKSLRLMASYPLARASVLTINRVQNVALNLVSKDTMTADVLLEMWNRGMTLDTGRYIGRTYHSIYIADASFIPRSINTNAHSK
jgi:hypothetical protein